MLSGRRWHGDLTLVRAGDEGLVAAVTVTPVRDATEAIVGSVIGLEDVTDVRSAEAEALASEVRLRLAHAAAELGTWHWDALAGIAVWDAQMHHIYGLAPGGFDGTWEAWVASIHPEDRREAVAVVERAMAERGAYVLRNRILRPDGVARWIEAHGKVLVAPDGTAAGTIGCVQDVTARIEMEQRQQDAGARALLLQEVTAEFSRAVTPDEVATVHAAGLARVRAIVGADQPESLEDEQLLDTLASQCAIAAERAELFRRSSSISAELQLSLAASPLPSLDAFEVAAWYAPGGDDLEQVGGDWYDAIATVTGGLILVVGDVMGRGVRAATTMIHVRAGIRGLLTVESAPSALLEAADLMLARDAPEQFVTAAAVLMDPQTGTLELCSAGHIPLVLVRPDGSTELVGLDPGTPRESCPAWSGPASAPRSSRAASSSWSPTAWWSPATGTSTRASSWSAPAPRSCARGRWRSWSPGSPRWPTGGSATTSPWSRRACAEAHRSSRAATSATAVGAPATYQSTPAARTCRVAPPRPRMMAAPGSSSHGGTPCWHSTCSRPSAMAIASIVPEPSIRSVAAPPATRPKAAPISPPKCGGCR